MSLDLLSLLDANPNAGEVIDTELAVTDDVLLKAFVLAPDASIEPHSHPDATNVFHVVRGSVTVEQDGKQETITAPGAVLNERGQDHGVQNDTGDVAVITASLCPLPE